MSKNGWLNARLVLVYTVYLGMYKADTLSLSFSIAWRSNVTLKNTRKIFNLNSLGAELVDN